MRYRTSPAQHGAIHPKEFSSVDLRSWCAGKRIFWSYADADRHSKWLRRVQDDNRVRPFRCEVCRKWHVGEQQE